MDAGYKHGLLTRFRYSAGSRANSVSRGVRLSINTERSLGFGLGSKLTQAEALYRRCVHMLAIGHVF